MTTPDEIWKCSDGRKIPVGELEPEHMRSILRMLIRNQRAKQEVALNQLAKQLAILQEREADKREALHDSIMNDLGMEQYDGGGHD